MIKTFSRRDNHPTIKLHGSANPCYRVGSIKERFHFNNIEIILPQMALFLLFDMQSCQGGDRFHLHRMSHFHHFHRINLGSVEDRRMGDSCQVSILLLCGFITRPKDLL